MSFAVTSLDKQNRIETAKNDNTAWAVKHIIAYIIRNIIEHVDVFKLVKQITYEIKHNTKRKKTPSL